MSARARLLIPLLLCGIVAAGGFALAGGSGPAGAAGVRSTLGPGGPGGPGVPGPDSTIVPSPTPRPPLGGRELYGYVPYWEMNGATVAHLRDAPLSTIGLFSVTARRTGELNAKPLGYRRITGPIGRRIIDEAHERGARVELVFTSFGAARNAALFGRVPAPSAEAGAAAPWHRTVDELVELAADLGVDGINVDVELLDPLDREAFREFLVTLRSELVARNGEARLSVATEAGRRGVANAAAAAAAGVGRIFLMGYDYHWSGSQPGASAPIDRSDGMESLRWSIDAYVAAGVPRDRILLGLPLYGMTWGTLGPDRTSFVVDRGAAWIPRRNLDVLLEPSFAPGRDAREVAEYFVLAEGDRWRITYYDSPATLRPKLALALDNGLAGGGFWAIGYERGVPGYLELMDAFASGDVKRDEAPPR